MLESFIIVNNAIVLCM